MRIEIKPLDTVFFRNGKPFNQEKDTWASGIFPPSPSVLYGALRTAYISNKLGYEAFKRGTMQTTVGTPESYGAFRISEILYNVDGLLYFHLPRDLTSQKDDPRKTMDRTIVSQLQPGELTNSPVNTLAVPQEGVMEYIEGGLIMEDDFYAYLLEDINSATYLKISDHVLSEHKTGLAMDYKLKRAKEGALYKVDMLRLKKVSFIVATEGIEDFPQYGVLRLGGEGRAAFFKKVAEKERNILLKLCRGISQSKKFKLVLQTPACFVNGWLPGWLKQKDEGLYRGKVGNVEVRLVTAFLGKPIYVGGWNIHKQIPKRMVKCVPPGSVYYFEILEGDASEVFDLFHGKSMEKWEELEYETSYEHEGFGISYVGVVR